MIYLFCVYMHIYSKCLHCLVATSFPASLSSHSHLCEPVLVTEVSLSFRLGCTLGVYAISSLCPESSFHLISCEPLYPSDLSPRCLLNSTSSSAVIDIFTLLPLSENFLLAYLIILLWLFSR